MPTDHTLVADDGTELVVRVAGDGPPVVYLHGSNGGLDSWAAIAEDVPGHSRWLVARRGHEPSGIPRSRNTFEVEARDALVIAKAAHEATGHRPHLVGGSYGASVALHAAKTSTEHVVSLALFEPPLLLSGPHLEPVLVDYLSLCAAGTYDEALGLFVRRVARVPDAVLAAAPSAPPDPDANRRAATGARGDLEAMAADTTDTDRWATIDVPVLLMQGADSWDPLPEGMARLSAALPRAELLTWDGQSHFVTATAPELVSAALGRFFDHVGPG